MEQVLNAMRAAKTELENSPFSVTARNYMLTAVAARKFNELCGGDYDETFWSDEFRELVKDELFPFTFDNQGHAVTA